MFSLFFLTNVERCYKLDVIVQMHRGGLGNGVYLYL